MLNIADALFIRTAPKKLVSKALDGRALPFFISDSHTSDMSGPSIDLLAMHITTDICRSRVDWLPLQMHILIGGSPPRTSNIRFTPGRSLTLALIKRLMSINVMLLQCGCEVFVLLGWIRWLLCLKDILIIIDNVCHRVIIFSLLGVLIIHTVIASVSVEEPATRPTTTR